LHVPEDVIERLERFVNDTVEIDPAPTPEQALARKLDVLARVVELLRLGSGQSDNRTSMQELLERGLDVCPSSSRALVVHVGGLARARTVGAGRSRLPSELQECLLLHLLHRRSRSGSIGDDLHEFVVSIRDDLAPRDVESTRTGVMRIATTTRDAARVLRMHGLVRDNDETRGRRWDLSLLGVLTAVEVGSAGRGWALPARAAYENSVSRFGEGDRLASSLEETIGQFGDPGVVAGAIRRLCSPDSDVFPTFDVVVQALAAFCRSLVVHWQALDARASILTSKDVRAAADAMLRTIQDSVPAGIFAEEVNQSLALDQLLGQGRRKLGGGS
jgi:hypothetical protein